MLSLYSGWLCLFCSFWLPRAAVLNLVCLRSSLDPACGCLLVCMSRGLDKYCLLYAYLSISDGSFPTESDACLIVLDRMKGSSMMAPKDAITGDAVACLVVCPSKQRTT